MLRRVSRFLTNLMPFSLEAGHSSCATHLAHTPGLRPRMPGGQRPTAVCRKLPTFLYAMPFSKTRVFLEETSLVARPAVAFEELRERLRARMAHMGIRVTAVEEEEFCLIPMGGVLPKFPQRVLGIGGTGGMVHPSTGESPPADSWAQISEAETVMLQEAAQETNNLLARSNVGSHISPSVSASRLQSACHE